MRSVGRLLHKVTTRSEKRDDLDECLLKWFVAQTYGDYLSHFDFIVLGLTWIGLH